MSSFTTSSSSPRFGPTRPLGPSSAAPALASENDKQAIIDVTQDLVDSVMVVSEPFLVAYGLGLYNNALVVDIGAGTLDLCRMHGTIPEDEDQRTLYKAGSFIDDKFHGLLQEKVKDSPISLNQARSIKERYAFVSPITEGISVEFQVEGKAVLYNIAEELKAACEEVLPDTLAAIRELITTFEPEFQDELRNNIVLAGGGQIRGLPVVIESDLAEFGPARVTVVDDPVYAGAARCVKTRARYARIGMGVGLIRSMPPNASRKGPKLPAGFGLSSFVIKP